MEERVQSVTKTVNSIKGLLEGEFRNLVVEGEISNLTSSAAGHWYFTLSDAQSSLSTALFKMNALRNPLLRKLKNGEKVICVGDIGVYSKRGTFQLITRMIYPKGKGDLKAQYEVLKKRLTEEGLFDLEYKQDIPQFPAKVGVITALKAAALQDFLNVYKRRSYMMDIKIFPALVQGDTAAASIITAIRRSQEYQGLDVLVITRGGGSLEDLWAFNDEQLVREIYQCPTPIVSAIGHETDFTLTDLVADLRCETPTAAAEILTQPQTHLGKRLEHVRDVLRHKMEANIHAIESSLHKFHPRQLLQKVWEVFYQAQKLLSEMAITNKFYELTRIHEAHQRVDDSIKEIESKLTIHLGHTKFRIDKAKALLDSLRPQNVLKRGFTYLEGPDGKTIPSAQSFKKLAPNASINIHFHDGIGKLKNG